MRKRHAQAQAEAAPEAPTEAVLMAKPKPKPEPGYAYVVHLELGPILVADGDLPLRHEQEGAEFRYQRVPTLPGGVTEVVIDGGGKSVTLHLADHSTHTVFVG